MATANTRTRVRMMDTKEKAAWVDLSANNTAFFFVSWIVLVRWSLVEMKVGIAAASFSAITVLMMTFVYC